MFGSGVTKTWGKFSRMDLNVCPAIIKSRFPRQISMAAPMSTGDGMFSNIISARSKLVQVVALLGRPSSG